MATSPQRSPNYPGHDLGQSLKDLTLVYRKEKTSPFPLVAAAKDIGFKGLNGAARVRLAAMRQYGLLEQPRRKEGRLTERALTLVLRDPASREYQQALREAALEPTLFRQFAQTRLNSSDDTLAHILIVNEKFTTAGAAKFIKPFRFAMSLARIEDKDVVSRPEDDTLLDQDEEDAPMRQPDYRDNEPDSRRETPRDPAGHTRVPLRLLGGELWVEVLLPNQMTEEAWDQMLGMLHALKPGYVRDSGRRETLQAPASPSGEIATSGSEDS